MLKKIFYKIMFLITAFSGFLSYSQKIDSSYMECKYLTTFLIDTANINTQKKEYTSLLIGKKSSIFRSNQKAIADSMALSYIKATMENAGRNSIPEIHTEQLVSAKYKPEVYFSEGKLTIYNEILEELYGYSSDKKVNWVIGNGKKMIRGYSCREATGKYGNKMITAWYTDAIPIQEGPYTFKGLPGLVLEAYDFNDYFHFVLVGLKNIKKPINSPKKSIYTTYEKFYNKRKQIMDDPLGAFMGSFGRRAPKENEERIIKNIRSINNFLD